jgi:hypothetical protein
MKEVFKIMEREWRLLVVNLLDSTMCGQRNNFIAGALVSLSSMINLEMTQINILTKIDLIKMIYPEMDFSLNFYTEMQDMSQMFSAPGQAKTKQRQLGKKIAKVLDNFSLVNFVPL